MSFDDGLVERIRDTLADRRGIVEKRMFGGIAFMSRGYMFVGIVGDVLMARVGPADYEEVLTRPHVREMDLTGRPMRGYVFVDPPGFENDDQLADWVERCHLFVQSLPRKPVR